MALITASQIATMLGVDASIVDSNIYAWAKAQFFILTGLKESETTRHFRKHIAHETQTIKLADKNISSITSIYLDNVELEYTNYTEYTLNPDTGIITFPTEVIGYLDIEYKVAAYTQLDIHNYLLSLLVYKSLLLFKPADTNQVMSFSIGKYSKTFMKSDPIVNLDLEIEKARDIILGDNGGLTFGGII